MDTTEPQLSPVMSPASSKSANSQQMEIDPPLAKTEESTPDKVTTPQVQVTNIFSPQNNININFYGLSNQKRTTPAASLDGVKEQIPVKDNNKGKEKIDAPHKVLQHDQFTVNPSGEDMDVEKILLAMAEFEEAVGTAT